MHKPPPINSHLLYGSKLIPTYIADTPVLVVFGPKHIKRIVTNDDQLRLIYLEETELRQLEIQLVEQEVLQEADLRSSTHHE
jgi:hypothetical protein